MQLFTDLIILIFLHFKIRHLKLNKQNFDHESVITNYKEYPFLKNKNKKVSFVKVDVPKHSLFKNIHGHFLQQEILPTTSMGLYLFLLLLHKWANASNL